MRFHSRSKEFANFYLKLHRVTVQVAEPALKVEVRRMANGVEFHIDHLHRAILVRFPGMSDWVDFFAIKKLGTTKIMQSQIVSTLPEFELDEVRKQLKTRGGSK